MAWRTYRNRLVRTGLLRRRDRGSDDGYTLLELLVVIGILGLLAGVAAAAFRSPSASVQLRAASDELISELRIARSVAISEHRPVIFRFHTEEHRWERPPSTAGEWPSEISLSLQSHQSDSQIVFFPDGSSSGGEVTLTAEVASRVIVVDWLTGRVRSRD